MQIKTRPVVRCQICYTECSGTGARTHKLLTGHNLWELLLPVEKKVVEYTPNPYSLGVRDTQERALDSGDKEIITEDNKGA